MNETYYGTYSASHTYDHYASVSQSRKIMYGGRYSNLVFPFFGYIGHLPT